MHTTILTLYKKANSERKISEITGIHRDTVRRVIKRYKEEKLETPASL